MKLSQRIKQLIKQWEGCCLTAYRCPSGVVTIGYGHTEGVKLGQRITQTEADALFESDINEFADAVTPLIGAAPVNGNQFDALVSLAYNIGTAAFSKSTLLRKVRANPDDPSIRAEFDRWVRGGGRVLPGLVKRRSAEANHYFS